MLDPSALHDPENIVELPLAASQGVLLRSLFLLTIQTHYLHTAPTPLDLSQLLGYLVTRLLEQSYGDDHDA